MKRNNKLYSKKQEITLMTLLAHEAAKDSSAMLKKYNKPKAQNHDDLEVKLAELYFEQPDKLQIEKELAEIHPHKNWLIRSLDLVDKKDVKCKKCEEKQEIDSDKTEKLAEIKNAVSESVSQFSAFNGSTKEAPQPTIVTNTPQGFSSIEIIGMVGAIGLIGLTFIIVSKNLTK
jgi:hypothetical protein